MGPKKRILVVDDEFNVVQMLKLNLEAEGYEVVTAYDGEEGLGAIRSQSPDLVLCDVTMPGADGLDLCRCVREQAGLNTISFIFLSARSEMPNKLDGFHAGADDYITKPFHLDELMARVHAVLLRVERIRADSRDMFDQAMRDLNRLSTLGIVAASIAHEVRNQLASVASSAELIRLTKDEAERERYSHLVFSHVDRINQTVYSMLNFARQKDIKREFQQIPDIVREALDITRPRLFEGNVEIACHFVESLPKVRVDRQQICQVLVNLIINASQAVSGRGYIEITAGSEGDYVAIRVSDNGRGISEATLSTLFEPFKTTRQQSGGIGLGLYICREIMTAHNGHIEAQNRERAGTCFTLRVPMGE